MALVCLCSGGPALAGQLKDPTRPPAFREAPRARAAVKKRAPSFALRAVLVSPGRRVAVINGQTLRVGQKVDGFEVVEIEPSHVGLRKGRKVLNLELAKSSVKKSSPRAEEGSK